jgi:hypothetical protein
MRRCRTELQESRRAKRIQPLGRSFSHGGMLNKTLHCACSLRRYHGFEMSFPIKTCVICHEEFELRPGKPGFANRCPSCSEPEETESAKTSADVVDRHAASEMNAERRRAIRDMLYRKES